jgi:dihydrofolate reductase
MGELLSRPYDLLLGRKTYDIFAAHWPRVTDPKAEDYAIAEQFNRVRKYVATHRSESLAWNNSVALGSDPITKLREIKKEDGPDLLTQGSSELVHALLTHDVVDELRVLTFPIVLGKGKRLFDAGSKAMGLRLESTKTSPNGIVIASYVRAGNVKTGSFALDDAKR